MEYKKILSWLKPFLKYGGHKICNFELFCWQNCLSDSPSCTECKKLHQNICISSRDIDQCLSQTHRQTEIFLLHFWYQGPSKRIFPLR
ncbi:hypothetical protein O3M35_005241 [Rhynocoris fuscipes]|uniref:Uncharacterized protein n=1 Tax=Rhynocoris fuscipes TaxID=488301 RepID=A0AAW1DHG7_9HEMI